MLKLSNKILVVLIGLYLNPLYISNITEDSMAFNNSLQFNKNYILSDNNIKKIHNISIYDNYGKKNHSTKGILIFIIKNNPKFIIFNLLYRFNQIILVLLLSNFMESLQYLKKSNKDDTQSTKASSDKINTFLIKALIIIAFSIIGYILNNWFAFYKNQTSDRLYNTLFKKVLDQPYETYNEQNYNSILEHLDTIIARSILVIDSLIEMSISVGYLFYSLIKLINLSAMAGVLYIVLQCLLLIYGFFGFHKQFKIFLVKKNEAGLNVNNFTNDSLKNFMLIKSLGVEQEHCDWLSQKEIKFSLMDYKTESIKNRFAMMYFIVNMLYVMAIAKTNHDKIFDIIITILYLKRVALLPLMRSFPKILSSFKHIEISIQGLNLSFKKIKYIPYKLTGNFIIKNGQKTFNKEMILKDINLQIDNTLREKLKKDKLKIGIIGTSGSGKTSLVKVIDNLYTLDNNGLFFEVEDKNNKVYYVSAKKVHPKIINEYINFLPQDHYFYNDTFKNNIILNKKFIDNDKLMTAIENNQMSNYIANKKEGLNAIISPGGANLSGGQRQRIGFIRFEAHTDHQSIRIIDEGDTALDKKNKDLLMGHITNGNYKTALVITHSKEMANQMDYLFVLDKGAIIAEGTPEEIFQDNKYQYLN